ncbi:MAG: hypothetical protein V3R77_02180, partial [Candidatus Binatia bacterium]
DHFLCYKGRVEKGDLVVPSGLQVVLTDDFEADRVYDVRKPRGICNPADKNGEGVVDDVTHLTPYQIKIDPLQGRHVAQTGVRVFNQFGDILVNTIKEDRVLLPAIKDALGGPVSAPTADAHGVDHYKCYKAKLARGSAKFAKRQVTIEDQFESPAKTYDIKKPALLCTPVDRDGEGIKNLDGHMMCYKAKPSKGQTKHEPRLGISTADSFVIHKMDTKKEELLCVPSLKDPPAEFCGDGVVNQPPFEDCDGDAGMCGPGEICTTDCQCLTPVLGQRTLSLSAGSEFQSGFTGAISLATPAGTLVLDGGALDIGTGIAPVTLAGGPAYIAVDINLGAAQTLCYEILSCTGSIYCTGGTNVDVLESLDSLPASEPSCVQDGTNTCTNDPANFCCSNSCEGAEVGSGNVPTFALGTGVDDSGNGALELVCDIRQLAGLPIGTDCSVQDYSSVTAVSHGFTTGTATAEVTQHCAGNASPADVVPTFAATGVNFDCATWTVEDGPGTIAWALPTEEPSALVGGDGSNAFRFQD